MTKASLWAAASTWSPLLQGLFWLMACLLLPMIGAGIGVGRRADASALALAARSGTAMAFVASFFGLFDYRVFYSGPLVGAVGAWALARWLSR